MKTIESKINSIVDKILKEELSTKVNSAVKRVNEKLEGNENYTTKKTKTSKDEVEESMTIKPKGMGMNLKKKSFDLSEMEDSEMNEDNNMDGMYLGIGDHGFYDKDDREMKDFDFDYDEEDMGEEVDEMEENYKVAKERKVARMEKNEELKGNQDKIDKNKNGKIDAEDFKMLRKDKKEKPRTPAGFEHGEIVSGYMKESKKKTIQLTEDEVIELIQRMVMEEKEQNSIKITNKNLKDSKKENDESTKETTKRMKEYTKNMGISYEADNKEFPRGNTKMDIEDMGKIKKDSDKKKAYKASDAVEEYIDQIARSGGMENLDYDQIKPNDEWLELNIEGSSKTGNSQDYANAIPTDVNKKVNERRKKNILAMLKKQSYQKAPQSVYDVAGESTHLEKMLGIGESIDEKKQTKINEDINKMKNLLNYRKNTQ